MALSTVPPPPLPKCARKPEGVGAFFDSVKDAQGKERGLHHSEGCAWNVRQIKGKAPTGHAPIRFPHGSTRTVC
eukprot:6205083-Pleurochrysis_carterae.AAC.6